MLLGPNSAFEGLRSAEHSVNLCHRLFGSLVLLTPDFKSASVEERIMVRGLKHARPVAGGEVHGVKNRVEMSLKVVTRWCFETVQGEIIPV